MAGAFAGIVYPDVFQVTDLIEPMLSPLKHRSYGKKHFFNYKNFQFGCYGTGFSTNQKKNTLLYLDGEILNVDELKKALPANLHDKTVEELLIECYQLFGIDFLKMLDGEFALMLLDQEKNYLYLARDRIGKKPLYWYHDKTYFLFASELKSLLASGIVPKTADKEAIGSYLFFGYSPQDLTPVKDVNKLLPAYYLFLNNFHGKQILPYWSYSSYFAKRIHEHKSKILTRLDELIRQSIDSRLPKEGAISCIISGGLGSGTIAYYVSRLAQGRPIHAFTTGFGEESEEDIESAELVAHRLHISQSISEISPQYFIDNFAKIAWHLDEPLGDPNVIATWKLAESVRPFSKSAFSGMGSDELLAAHSRYTLAERALSRNLFQLPPAIQKICLPLLNRLSPNLAFHFLKMIRKNHWQFEYLNESALFDSETIKKASPISAGFDPDTFLHKFYNLPLIRSNVSSLLYFDVKTRLPDLYILQYERLMSVNGISWQTPFLDTQLVEFAAGLPEPETILESEAGSYLKPLIKDLFPPTFVNRPKKTRKHFLSSWADVPEIARLFHLLKRGTVIETGLISRNWLDDCLLSREAMKENFSQLFAILSLEVWFRLFFNRAITPAAPAIPLDHLLEEN